MNQPTAFVLFLVAAVVFFYVLYIVIRRAVAGGIRDAREASASSPTPATHESSEPSAGA